MEALFRFNMLLNIGFGLHDIYLKALDFVSFFTALVMYALAFVAGRVWDGI